MWQLPPKTAIATAGLHLADFLASFAGASTTSGSASGFCRVRYRQWLAPAHALPSRLRFSTPETSHATASAPLLTSWDCQQES